MYYLISIFTPINRESDNDLFDLIYRPIQSEDETNRGNYNIKFYCLQLILIIENNIYNQMLILKFIYN